VVIRKNGRYRQGVFRPNHPEKYLGNPSNIIFRSSWEFQFLRKIDNDPNVIAYSSEEVSIPYVSPVDGRTHRYFPDVIVKMKGGKIYMYEIKPVAQTQQPKQSMNRKKMITEAKTFAVNTAKWAAARAYCERNGITFVILTEKELGIRTK